MPSERAEQAHPFTDPVSGRSVVLVMTDDPESRPYDGSHGVRHDGCDRLADVSPELDAFYCRACRFSGRISGAWFMDLWMAASGA